MDVRIGKNNLIFIPRNILNKIFSTIKQYRYETGGIIGINSNEEIVEFHFDKPFKPNLFEYCPNVYLLNQMINENWKQNNIEFAGFVHSHLNNIEISQQDIKYSKSILLTNKFFDKIFQKTIDKCKKTVYNTQHKARTPKEIVFFRCPCFFILTERG